MCYTRLRYSYYNIITPFTYAHGEKLTVNITHHSRENDNCKIEEYPNLVAKARARARPHNIVYSHRSNNNVDDDDQKILCNNTLASRYSIIRGLDSPSRRSSPPSIRALVVVKNIQTNKPTNKLSTTTTRTSTTSTITTL